MAANRLHGGKKGKRSARNKASGKYVRQRIRTEANKKRRAGGTSHGKLQTKEMSALD
jgi:hypothetical protein